MGVAADEVAEQLAPYRKHRTTGQPWVVLKMAASLDGRTAAPDGTSRWITGEAARRDVHRLRARSDAVLVGAGTVRSDDPELTVRLDDGVEREQPLRVVLGKAPADAKVHPALELSGDLGDVLDRVGTPRACSSCWWRAGPAWPTISTPPAWSTATSCTSHRCFSVATTAARFSRAPGLAQLVTCGRAGWCRSSSWVRIFEWRWRPDGVLEGAGGHRLHRAVWAWPSSSTTRTGRTRATSSWRPRRPRRRTSPSSWPTPRGSSACPLLPERADALDLPLMVTANTEAQRTAFTVSVDYRHGTTTGHLGGRPGRHHRRADRPAPPGPTT